MSKDDLTTKEQSKKGNKDNSKDSKSKDKKKMSQFYKELKSEFKKIVWPTKDALKHNTAVALTFMGLSAAFIWILDWIFISIFALMY